MGVMECNRQGCRKGMCTQLFQGIYICDSCLDELRTLFASWPGTMTGNEFNKRVNAFRRSLPGETQMKSTTEMFHDSISGVHDKNDG